MCSRLLTVVYRAVLFYWHTHTHTIATDIIEKFQLHKGYKHANVSFNSNDHSARGRHSNIFYTPIFVLGQSESQKSR